MSGITWGCDVRHFGGAVVSYQLSGVSCLLAAVRLPGDELQVLRLRVRPNRKSAGRKRQADAALRMTTRRVAAEVEACG